MIGLFLPKNISGYALIKSFHAYKNCFLVRAKLTKLITLLLKCKTSEKPLSSIFQGCTISFPCFHGKNEQKPCMLQIGMTKMTWTTFL